MKMNIKKILLIVIVVIFFSFFQVKAFDMYKASQIQYTDKSTVAESLNELYSRSNIKFQFNNLNENSSDYYVLKNFPMSGNGTKKYIIDKSKFGTVTNNVLTIEENGLYYISSIMMPDDFITNQIYNQILINDIKLTESFSQGSANEATSSGTVYLKKNDRVLVQLVAYGSRQIYKWELNIYKIF